ncbi:MAG: hypothetical protein JO254_08870 [Pseudolabrys sp.]|nr:hypothetical protein [Pseudolabrys sp.]
MLLNLQSLLPAAHDTPFEASLDAPNLRERIVTIAATSLGVLVVAMIAALMGLVN